MVKEKSIVGDGYNTPTSLTNEGKSKSHDDKKVL